MPKITLNTTRRPNYLRAGIKFKDGLPLDENGEAVEVVEVDVKQLEALKLDPNIKLKEEKEPAKVSKKK